MKPISRREMLSKATFLGSAAIAVTAAEPSPSGTSVPTRAKLKVVVTGGHPGDPEYGCGGTIARYTDLGHEVVLLYLNRGEWPENPLLEDAKSVRIAEAKRACEILKARPAYAGQVNGAAIVDAAHYEKFHRILEAEQPNLVFTHWPIDNHADHRAISLLVYEAWLRMGKKFGLYYTRFPTGRTPFSSPLRTTSILQGPRPGSVRPATPMRAKPQTGSTRSRKWSRGCAALKAATNRPKATSGVFKALTLPSLWPDLLSLPSPRILRSPAETHSVRMTVAAPASPLALRLPPRASRESNPI
jgi:N-acetylglucosamine malate deacetylase 1